LEWKLFDKRNKLIQKVNCQYDSLDIANWDNDAVKVVVDFKNKCTYILETEGEKVE